MNVKEVPSDHDFFDPAYVKQWTDSIIRYRPEREQVFRAFAAEAARIEKPALSVFELGCGPGFLAEALLENCQIERYTLIDFSPQMLELSRNRLAKFKDKTVFIQRNFKEENWTDAVPAGFDLVVVAPGRARAPSREPYSKALRAALQPARSRRNYFDLRSRQFFFALRSSRRPFHDGRRAPVDVQGSWFYQGERDLPRRRPEPDGSRKALRSLVSFAIVDPTVRLRHISVITLLFQNPLS